MALSPQQVSRIYSIVATAMKAFKDAKSGKWIVPPKGSVAKLTDRVSRELYPNEPPPPPPEPENA